MKKLIVLGGTFFLLCGVSGCGGDSHEVLIKDMIRIVNDTAKVLQSITDAARPEKKDEKAEAIKGRVLKKARQAAQQLKELGKELQGLSQRAAALRETLSKEEKTRLEKEFKDRFQSAMKNTNAEWEKLKNLKAGDNDFGKEVIKVLEQEDALQDFAPKR
jgi:hypothetical protein